MHKASIIVIVLPRYEEEKENACNKTDNRKRNASKLNRSPHIDLKLIQTKTTCKQKNTLLYGKKEKVKGTIFDHTLYTRKENTLKYTIIII